MSNFSDVMTGLKTVLGTAITDANIHLGPPAGIGAPPAIVLQLEAIDMRVAFGGNTFTMPVRVTCLIAAADEAEGWRQVYDYMDPTTGSKSVTKAIRDNKTLGGSADDADVIRIEKVGRRDVNGQWFFGFDAIVEVIKTVA